MLQETNTFSGHSFNFYLHWGNEKQKTEAMDRLFWKEKAQQLAAYTYTIKWDIPLRKKNKQKKTRQFTYLMRN